MKKIRTKIILLSCMLCICSIFFATLIGYSIVSDNIMIETFGRLNELTNKNANKIENWFAVQQKLLVEIHDEINYHSFYVDYEKLIPYLAYKNQTNSDVIEYYLALEDSTFVTANGYWIPDDTYNLETREWYKSAIEKNDIHLSSPYIDSNHGGLIVTLSMPLYSSSNFIGVLGADIYIDRIVGVLDENSSIQDGYIYIVDNKGNILAHPNPDYLLSNTGQLIKADDVYSEDYTSLKIGEMLLNKYSDYDEVDRIISYTDMGSTDWKIGLAINEDAIMAPLDKIINNTIILTLALMFIATLLTFILGNNIANPLKDAKIIIDKIAMKDISDNPNKDYYTRDDEIGSMFLSIHQILESLRSFLNDLQSLSSRVSIFSSELSSLSLKTSFEADSLYDRASTIEEARNIRSEKINNLSVLTEDISSRLESLSSILEANYETPIFIDDDLFISINSLKKEIEYILELGRFDMVETKNTYDVIEKQKNMMEEVSSASQCLDELVKELDDYINTFRK